jgi:hypothetical protein
VAVGERLSTTRIQKDKVERSALDRVQHVIPLLFGVELMSEVVAIGPYFIGAESHECLPFGV